MRAERDELAVAERVWQRMDEQLAVETAAADDGAGRRQVDSHRAFGGTGPSVSTTADGNGDMGEQMLQTTQILTAYCSATHVVVGLPGWHPEAKVHGHQRQAEPHLAGPGEELTHRDVDAVERELALWARETLDYRHLNEVMANRTTEPDVAVWPYEQWAPRLEYPARVRVSARLGEWTGYTPATGR